MIIKKNSMFMHLVNFVSKLVIWCRIGTNSSRLKVNIHNFKISSLIPIRRLGKNSLSMNYS